MSKPTPDGIRRRQREDLSHYEGFANLESGGQGTVSVVMECDPHGTIISRCAVKDTYHDNVSWSFVEWLDGWPADITAMYRLQNQTTCDKPLHIEGARVYQDLKMYRMFLEFAPHGDLWSTFNRYREANVLVPEPFLWYIAKSMVEMGVLMSQGDLVKPKAKWRALSHNDIKLDNVVLAAPLAEFPSYPTPKLMDFGHVVELYPGNPRPLTDLCAGGTLGWLSPERLPAWGPIGPMTQTSDVYSFGLVLYHLMNRTTGLPGAPAYTPEGRASFGPPGLGTAGALHYTRELKAMVIECLHRDPLERPSFLVLRGHIRALLASPPRVPDMQKVQTLSATTLAMAGDVIAPEQVQQFALSHREDQKYRVGTACQFLV